MADKLRVWALIPLACLLGACTSLPGPPGDPTKYRRTKVDGPGNLSKVVYGKSETPRNMPKSKSGNRSTYTVFGQQYSVLDTARGFREQGVASWYGSKFHGRHTASGEVYNMYDMTAAHKHLPLPTFVRVTNLDNGKQLVVKVNDRGPFVDDRIIDLSYGAAARIGMLDKGTARVKIAAISENTERPAPQKTIVAARTPPDNEQFVEILASGQNPEQQLLPSGTVVRKPVQVRREDTRVALPASRAGDVLPGTPTPAQTTLATTNRATLPLVAKPAAETATASAAGSAEIQSGTVIQVGAFSNPANAELMRLRVNRAVDDDAAIIHATQGGSLLRVQIGPLPAQAPVDQIMMKLRNAGIADIKQFEL